MIHYFYVETPEVAMTWIGGPLVDDGEHVWLTKPGGEKILRVLRRHVTPSTPEETARRIVEERASQ